MASPYRKRMRRRRRDLFTPQSIAKQSLHPLRRSVSVSQSDLRLFHPYRTFRPIPGSPRGVRRDLKRSPSRAQTKALALFREPRRVMLCVRRAIRREVLLAFGRGGGGNRKPRRNQWSDISCR